MREIHSCDNSILQRFAKLSDKKYRREFGLYLVESVKMVKDAVQFGLDMEAIFIRSDVWETYQSDFVMFEDLIYLLCPAAFSKLTDTCCSQGVVAAIRIPDCLPIPACGNALILDHIADPGNLGTIIRTANACGYRDLYLVDCVDCFNPKVVRSTMSGIFQVRAMVCTIEQALDCTQSLIRIAADMDGKNVFDVEKISKHALIIGSESHGVSECLRENSSLILKLPMYPGAESLNASVAASVLMYQLEFGKGKSGLL